MTESPAARHHREQQAGSLTTGSHILLPDGRRTAEIDQVELEHDDFGSPALVLARLSGGGTLRVALRTMVTVVDGAHGDAPRTVLDEEPLGVVAPVSPDLDNGDPLDALLAEYRRALIHRERSAVHAMKEIEQPQIAVPLPPDPFLDTERYRTGSLLSDLLDARQQIDRVLDGMNPFLSDELFVDDARHDVLHLLAPAQRRRPHFPTAALLARREHHLISVDSHFPMLTTFTDTSTTEQHDDERP